jgi:hypothetical protein
MTKYNKIRHLLPPINYVRELHIDYWTNYKMTTSELCTCLQTGTLPQQLVDSIDKLFEGPESDNTEMGISGYNIVYTMSLEQLEKEDYKIPTLTSVKLNDVTSKESKIYEWGQYYIRKTTTCYCTFD